MTRHLNKVPFLSYPYQYYCLLYCKLASFTRISTAEKKLYPNESYSKLRQLCLWDSHSAANTSLALFAIGALNEQQSVLFFEMWKKLNFLLLVKCLYYKLVFNSISHSSTIKALEEKFPISARPRIILHLITSCILVSCLSVSCPPLESGSNPGKGSEVGKQ